LKQSIFQLQEEKEALNKEIIQEGQSKKVIKQDREEN
jgi:hypothetical protein